MRFVYCNGHNSTSLFSGSPGKKEKMNISIKEETLGQRIRAQRIRLGMTQEELAKALETDPNYLIMGEKASESDNRFVNEAVELFSKITDPKMQEMLLKQIRALV